LFVISDNLPLIEIFNKYTQQRIDIVDFSDVKQINKRMRMFNAREHADNEYTILSDDVYITQNSLYLLLNSRDENELHVNEIIKFDILPTIKPVAIYKLPGDIYESFCVSEEDDKIYAFEYMENMIEVIPIINQ